VPVTALPRMQWPSALYSSPGAATAAVSGARSQATAPAVSVVSPDGKTSSVAGGTGAEGSRSELPGAIELANRNLEDGATAPAGSSSDAATPADPPSAPLPPGVSGTAATGSGTPTPGHATGTPPARASAAASGSSADPSVRRGKPDTETRADGPRPTSWFARRDAVYPAIGVGSLSPGSLYPASYYYNTRTTPTATPGAPQNQPPTLSAHDGQGPGDPSSADTPRRLTLWRRFMNHLHGGGDAPN